MKKKTLIISLVCIVAGALIFGFAYDGILTAVERLEHPQKYSESVHKYSAKYGVPENIIYSVIKTESGFDPEAVSRANCVGLMQLHPDTFRWISDDVLKEELPDSYISDPDTNIKYGTWYLSYLYGKFGKWETVYAAYNAGEGRVSEWLSNKNYSDDGKTLKNFPSEYGETKIYVKRVAKARDIYTKLYY